MKSTGKIVPGLTCVAMSLGILFATSLSGGEKAPAAAESARLDPEQARREVRMLDDLYKTSIVLINDTFVTDGNGLSAGEAGREIFAAMRKKGWHDARLLDATGKPRNDDNVARDAFEKRAIEKIAKGQAYYDEVVSEGADRYLRAATVVPVVNDKCILCHPGTKVGDVLGAIGYKIRLK